MKHEDLIEELRHLGQSGEGNGTTAMSITVYGNVNPGTETPYGPSVRQEVSLGVSIPNGSLVWANEQTVEGAISSAKHQIERLKRPVAA